VDKYVAPLEHIILILNQPVQEFLNRSSNDFYFGKQSKADTERLREIQDVLFLWVNMMY
jgi:hypothetical protein